MSSDNGADTVLVSATDLETVITGIFKELGVPSEHAALQARILVDADLRGVDTHGALLVPYYVKKFKAGLYNPDPKIRVVKETASRPFQERIL